MSLDPYQPCPCGGGKKIKFCCCRDITGDLDHVLRTLEGEQRLAALEQIDKLLSQHGPRAALLAIKVTTQMELGELDAAETTVEAFLQLDGKNPVALGQSALMQISQGDLPAAVDRLQSAIETVSDGMPLAVYEALGAVAQAMIAAGDILGARSHLVLQAAIGGADDTSAAAALLRIHGSEQVPLLMKQDTIFESREAEAAWAEPFGRAEALAGRGAWRAALAKLTPLAEKFPRQGAILKNIAILRGCLGDPAATTAAWRSYAAIEKLELDDAVEAEAMVQLLDPDAADEKLDVVTVRYATDDADPLMERLLSDSRVSQMPIDLRQLGDEDHPPPKAAFWLLDRPLPASGQQIAREEIPLVLGEMFLFGRQTDRQARLELIAVRGDNFDAKLAAAGDVLGEFVQGDPEEEVSDQVSARREALTWNWRFPDDTPPELRESLTVQQGREQILQRWSEVPLAAVGGKRPIDAAADQANRAPLLAAILLLELSDHQQRWGVDYNELREKLDLPLREPIDPSTVDVSALSLVRLALLEIGKLNDDDLVGAYQRAARLGAGAAVKKLAAEVVARDSLAEKVDLSEAYELLSRTSDDRHEALEYLSKARQAAVKQGNSPAPFLLTELALQLELHNAQQCQRLMTEIRSRHINEPGVAQVLFETLVRYGVIRPDGTPAGPRPGPPPAEVAATDQTEGASKLWTPGSDTPSEGGQQESKLWVPGMD